MHLHARACSIARMLTRTQLNVLRRRHGHLFVVSAVFGPILGIAVCADFRLVRCMHVFAGVPCWYAIMAHSTSAV